MSARVRHLGIDAIVWNIREISLLYKDYYFFKDLVEYKLKEVNEIVSIMEKGRIDLSEYNSDYYKEFKTAFESLKTNIAKFNLLEEIKIPYAVIGDNEILISNYNFAIRYFYFKKRCPYCDGEVIITNNNAIYHKEQQEDCLFRTKREFNGKKKN